MTALALLVAASMGSCVAVDGDRVLAGDLARAEPALQAIDASAVMGYAPAPGTRRVFHPAELARVASRYGVSLDQPREICVERVTERLTAGSIRAAIEAAADNPSATIEILEWSRYPVPVGKIEFPRAGLIAPGAAAGRTPALWKGWIRYGDSRRFAIWARVRISVPIDRVVANQPLAAGRAIQATDVRVESVSDFPFRALPAQSLAQVVGRIPRHSLPAGAPLFVNLLDGPREVASGDTVSVEVASGAARLALEGRAEKPGRRGEIIPVRNPSSGRTFQARVEGHGKVAVLAHGPAAATGEK